MLDQTTYETTSSLSDKRARAEASIKARQTRREARGYAVLSTMGGYGVFSAGTKMARVANAAKFFMIWFAMIAPILMVLHLR